MERQNVFQLVAPILAALTALLLFIQPIYAVYVVLLGLMLYLTWRQPVMVLTMIFISAPFQRDLSEGGRAAGTVAFSIAELLVASAIPGFILSRVINRRPIVFGPALPFIIIYLGICFISCAANNYDRDSLVSIAQMVLYLIVAVTLFASMADRLPDMLAIYRATVVVGVLLSVVLLAGGMSLLSLNKNGIGSSLAGTLLVCVELWFAETTPRRKAWYGIALTIMTLGLLFSLSRGAWLGTIGGLIVIATLRREFRLMLRVGVLLLFLFPIFWTLLPQEKRHYAFNFDRSSQNINLRYKSMDIAQKLFEQSPIIGVGVGIRKRFDATNLVWFTLAESGVLGLIAFVFVQTSLYRMLWVAHKYVKTSDPIYSFLAIAGALLTSKMLHGMVDHYWSRGVIMMSFGSVGLATRVYYNAHVATKKVAPDDPKLTPPVGTPAGRWRPGTPLIPKNERGSLG